MSDIRDASAEGLRDAGLHVTLPFSGAPQGALRVGVFTSLGDDEVQSADAKRRSFL